MADQKRAYALSEAVRVLDALLWKQKCDKGISGNLRQNLDYKR